MNRSSLAALAVVSLAAAASLTGCSTGVGADAAGKTGTALSGHITGTVHGGQQPVSGATIQLYAPGTAGYGSAATALLQNPVLTDANGNFNITGDYSCTGVDQVYLVATGGNPGVGATNPALAEMAALGSCSTLQANAATTSIVVSEVSTVAGAWSLARFMTSPTLAGVSSTNAAGLRAAFAASNRVVNLGSGTAPGNALPSGATLPIAEINTLADILASCINSTGSTASGTPCGNLFTAATPSGGTAPTDTLTAALNIARNPAANVAALYGLVAANAPYQPTLTAAPSNWLIGIHYTGGGLSQPVALAVDGTGNVWTANSGNNSVSEFSNAGVPLSPAAGYTSGSLSSPSGIAIDPNGYAWVANAGNNSVTQLAPLGASANNYTGGGLRLPSSVAVDGYGNVFVTNRYGNSVTELSNSGTILSGSTGYTGAGISAPSGVAINAH